MVDRINLILKAKNLTSRQFAEEIGIQPSGMSHILSGRNRPSLDFVMKVINRYPEIDINWLMFGKGEMYAAPYSMPIAHKAAPAAVSPAVGGVPAEEAAPAERGFGDFFVSPEASSSVAAPATERVETPAQGEPDLFSSVGFGAAADPVAESAAKETEAVVPSDSLPEAAVAPRAEAVEPAPVAVPTVDDSVLPHKDDKPQPVENRVYDKPSGVGAENRTQARKRIVKMVILYDDHSFSEYYPE